MSLFQFEKQSGWQAIELGQPKNLTEMAALNSVMRLMALEGGESPLERYARFRRSKDATQQDIYRPRDGSRLSEDSQSSASCQSLYQIQMHRL